MFLESIESKHERGEGAGPSREKNTTGWRRRGKWLHEGRVLLKWREVKRLKGEKLHRNVSFPHSGLCSPVGHLALERHWGIWDGKRHSQIDASGNSITLSMLLHNGIRIFCKDVLTTQSELATDPVNRAGLGPRVSCPCGRRLCAWKSGSMWDTWSPVSCKHSSVCCTQNTHFYRPLWLYKVVGKEALGIHKRKKRSKKVRSEYKEMLVNVFEGKIIYLKTCCPAFG